MSGISADTLFIWINVIFLSVLVMAAAGTIATYLLSARMYAAKDRELQQVQIEAARTDATQASARTAEPAKANTELQLELQEKKNARITVAEQSQPRDMTKEEMAKFVETIKDKGSQLNLIIVVKPPEFLRPSDQPIPSDMELTTYRRPKGTARAAAVSTDHRAYGAFGGRKQINEGCRQ